MENVRISVLSAYDAVCAFLDNKANDAMHFYDDELHQYLKGAANTYTFKTDAQHEKSIHLVEGNKLSFRYRNKDFYFNIMRVVRSEYVVEVESYSLNFELLNETKEPYKAQRAMSISEYLDVFDFENVLTLKINEVSDKRITHEWTGTETMLARIFSLATVFDSEAEFVPELNDDYSLKRIIINLYRKNSGSDQGIGRVRTDIKLRYGVNIAGVTKTSSITDLYTSIRPVGKDGLMIYNLDKTEYDASGKIEFRSPPGDGCIRAVQARDMFPSNLMSPSDRYITEDWSYDTNNVNVLYGQALAQLRKNCVPQVEYEVDGYVDTDVGDTVMIDDAAYNPHLYLQARVVEQIRSFTNPVTNKTKFNNFKELQSQIDPFLLQKMNDLIAANKEYTCSMLSDNGIVFKNGEGSTKLTASIMDVGKDVTGNFTIRWLKDGTQVATGKSVTVNANDISGKAVYKYEATDSKGTLRAYYEVTVANVLDGAAGDDGTGYTILLSNESYGFAAGTSAAVASNTATNVIAYKNTSQVATTITKIGTTSVSGNAVGVATGYTGLTADVSGNGTTSCKITFKATTALTTKNGNVGLYITVDGKSFTKYFSFSLALQGQQGSQGNPTGIVSSATEPTNKYTGMLWQHTGSVSGLVKDATYRWSGTKWELYYFSAKNMNVDKLSSISADLGTVNAGTINGVNINGSNIFGDTSIQLQKPIKHGELAGFSTWIYENENGISVKTLSPTTSVLGEAFITSTDIRLMSASRSFVEMNRAIDQLNNSLFSSVVAKGRVTVTSTSNTWLAIADVPNYSSSKKYFALVNCSTDVIIPYVRSSDGKLVAYGPLIRSGASYTVDYVVIQQ